MSVPYSLLFLGLLALYMVYSEWARLDSRYPIGAALVLLVAAAIADAAGSVSVANTFAEYVFFLLAAGVVLLLVDHLRDRRPLPAGSGASAQAVAPVGPAPEPVKDLEAPAKQALDGPEQ
jgi:hypothetical protein